MLNTVSTTTAPEIRIANEMPMMVMVGISAFLKACL